MLKAEQIVYNYESLIKFIKDNFEGDRRKGLLKIYGEDFSERTMYAPASHKTCFHGCFPGGYVYHILNVIQNAAMISDMWTSLSQEQDYTKEELLFVALNHDLGKLGEIDQAYYLSTDEAWKIKRGELYDLNGNVNMYMSHEDRSLFTLQQYNIPLTDKEFLGIKLHDGTFLESNKNYYISFSEYKQIRSNLPYIIHQADLMASRIEYMEYKRLSGNTSKNNKTMTTPLKKEIPKKYEDALRDIFGNKGD